MRESPPAARIGAPSHEIWKSPTNNPATATLSGATSGLVFDDFSGFPGTFYDYWVKGRSACGSGPFSGSNRGHWNACP